MSAVSRYFTIDRYAYYKLSQEFAEYIKMLKSLKVIKDEKLFDRLTSSYLRCLSYDCIVSKGAHITQRGTWGFNQKEQDKVDAIADSFVKDWLRAGNNKFEF